MCGDVLSRKNMGILRIFFLFPQTSLGDNHFKELPRAHCPLSELPQTSCCSGSILNAGGLSGRAHLHMPFQWSDSSNMCFSLATDQWWVHDERRGGERTSWKMCPFCWRFLSFRIRKNWWPLIYLSNNKYFLHVHLEVEPGADLGGGACAFDWWGSKWGKGPTFEPLLHLNHSDLWFYFIFCTASS